jgi:mannose-1-phosphate guanylyltransferase/mannose-6-phosphate isomerase
MRVYPVLLCGGSGARLWPASKPGSPKAFLPLTGALSGFQRTLMRVGRTPGFELPLVVAGVAHREVVAEQMGAFGLSATVILEPAPRDSGPAVAATAAFIARRDPGGVAIILACDHHLADEAAFIAALREAAQGAGAGHLVTLGVKPRAPSPEFGYIRPGRRIGSGLLRRVAAFVEKPDAATASRYLAAGYLWNSGDFVARASVLLDELRAHAPDLARAASAAEEARTESGVHLLSSSFLDSPAISFDHAVMEKTRRAAVLPVAFPWSDLGTWEAVRAASPTDDAGNASIGDCVLDGAEGCLVRVQPGRRVVAIGVRDLAIVVEDDGVLVCDLSASARLKALLEARSRAAPEPPRRPWRRLAHRRGARVRRP